MQVFFVNGNPRSGKDTFIDMVKEALNGRAYSTSWIDPVKEILGIDGLDLSAKTEFDRRLLADVGDSLERHSSFLSRRCVAFAEARLTPARTVFIYARQGGPIRTMEAMLHDLNPAIVTRRLLVVRPGVGELTSNAADAGVNLLGYDVQVHNDGTLDNLEDLAELFAALVRKNALPRKLHPAAVRPIPTKLFASASGETPLEDMGVAA